MAEIAVNVVIDKLAPLLVQEVKLLRGVHKEVTDIKAELESIQSFLRDADGKAETQDGVKTWLKQVREVAYDMEDAIDEYILHMAEGAHQRGFTAFLQKALCCTKKLSRRHEIANEIQDIKATICKIKERRERYGFNSSEQGSIPSVKSVAWHDDPRLTSLFIEEADVVGVGELKHQLISWLVKGEPKQTVISLVGMGGLGKTTLARKVFNHQEVKGNFDCNAWITVSQSYNVDEILRTMLKQFYGKEEAALKGIDTMESVQLIGKLREYLQQNRYLVVFDDVWEIAFWESIKHALPQNVKGSSIIITTRSGDVAKSSTNIVKLPPLPQEKALELFYKKVFRSNCCPKELEALSLDIVKKCQGLPLAIVVIGGLLSMKDKVASQWQMFHDSLGTELERNPHLTSITRILSLSYHDLPYYLKSSFLYFAIFPEDYSVRRGRLIRLWIAEGFVKEIKGKTLEDVAKEYLDELIQRSLVQISGVDFDGQARRCQVHDLMREILLSKYAAELSFCRVLAEKKDLVSFDGSIRRLSMHNYKENISESTNFSKVRSILLFEVNDLPKEVTDTFFTNYRLLKVLDFEDAPLENVPGELGNLFYLRYLSVRNTKVSWLPKSIGKLHNLETLDLRHSLVNELPIEILQLHKLRHLLGYNFNFDEKLFYVDYVQGVKIPEGIGSLEALQKLFYVEADHDGGLVRDLKRLIQLRKLGITKLKRENGMALCAAIEKMSNLLSLDVASINEDELLDMQSISSPPLHLQRLYLKGRLEKLPDWISKLCNLLRIQLNFSRLPDDPLNVLQSLPNLLELQLCRAYDGENLHFEASGFQKLKVLWLVKLDKLSLVIIDQGALPLLQELRIGRYVQVKEVPPGIQRLCRV